MPQPVRVFISYSHESERHAQAVLELANRLRREGIDAHLDLYNAAPAEGWIQWMESEVRQAQFILLICSPTFARRFDGRERPPQGRGVRWEGMLARILMWDETANSQLVPIIMGEYEDEDAIVPFVLRASPRFRYPQSYEALYRLLTDQPAHPPPALGQRVQLPSRKPESAGIPDRSYRADRPSRRPTIPWVLGGALALTVLIGVGAAVGIMFSRLLESVVLVRAQQMPETMHRLDEGVEAKPAGQLLSKLAFFALGHEADKMLYLWVTRTDSAGRVSAQPATAIRSGGEFELQPVSWDDNEAHFIEITQGPNPRVPVGVMLPGNTERCTDPAGRALYDGMNAFKNGHRRIRIVFEADHGDVDDARRAADKLREANVAAIVGSYHTRCTAELRQECELREEHEQHVRAPWARSRCGPIVTLSAATALRPHEVDVPWMFRVTQPNQERAAVLLRIVEKELRQEQDLLHVVYMDDSRPGSKVDYALDQARQLEALIVNHHSPSSYRVRWTRFRVSETGHRFYEGAPSEKQQELPLSGVDELIELMSKQGTGRKAWVLIAWDADIVAFGAALQALDEEETAQMRWYVPGPREVFEYDLAMCPDGDYLHKLEGARVLSPDDRHSSENIFTFLSAWGADPIRARTLPPMRAARIYDALQLLENAVEKVNERAREAKVDRVHLDLYRLWLRDVLAETRHLGATGFITFNDDGDMDGPTYLMHIQDGTLQPLPIIGPHLSQP